MMRAVTTSRVVSRYREGTISVTIRKFSQDIGNDLRYDTNVQSDVLGSAVRYISSSCLGRAALQPHDVCLGIKGLRSENYKDIATPLLAVMVLHNRAIRQTEGQQQITCHTRAYANQVRSYPPIVG